MAKGSAVLRVTFPGAKAIIQQLRSQLTRLKTAAKKGK